ncbi:NmrA domain-containing protein [Fusarium keratoplasticum]|nr:NmrA domain-containing protein [Fusarium keratoplasticum]
MVTTIAVAGGTRGIGRAIAEAINGKENYDVKVFSRSSNPALEAENGIPIIAIDYTDVDSMTKVLEDNKIDTVISTLFVTFDGKPQVNLIHAAEASKHTRRFIPSIWGIPYSREQVGERQMTIGQSKLDAVEALEKSTLEYTLFYVGYFLDFWGYPRVQSYQRQNLIVVDIEYNRAAIPGDGNTPVTFTHTFDVAEFVAASLDLPSWEKESYVIGESITWNEFLRLAEEVKGEKFEVTHDSLDLLLSGQITELPSHPSLYSQMPKDQIQALFATFGVWFEKGLFELKPTNKTLNEVFPKIHARTVKEVLEAGWGKQ